MPVETVVLRNDDERLPRLLADGWTVVGESWGARLVFDESLRPKLVAAVERSRARGDAVDELDPSEPGAARRLWELQQATSADFPITPATPAPDSSVEEIGAAWSDGWRVFGVRSGDALIAATVAAPGADGRTAETVWTAVRPEYRGRGLATALKSASVLALAADGVREFATGGAAINAASLAMNRATGYAITERWSSLRPGGSAHDASTASRP